MRYCECLELSDGEMTSLEVAIDIIYYIAEKRSADAETVFKHILDNCKTDDRGKTILSDRHIITADL